MKGEAGNRGKGGGSWGKGGGAWGAAAYREPLMARKARHKLKFILLDEFIVNLIKIYS